MSRSHVGMSDSQIIFEIITMVSTELHRTALNPPSVHPKYWYRGEEEMLRNREEGTGY